MTSEEIRALSEAVVDGEVVAVSARPYDDDDGTSMEGKAGDTKTVVCITFADGRMLLCVDPILL